MKMNTKQKLELENECPQVIVELVSRLRASSVPTFRRYNDYQTAKRIHDLLVYEIARYEKETLLENNSSRRLNRK
jgi:hypothetical protein